MHLMRAFSHMLPLVLLTIVLTVPCMPRAKESALKQPTETGRELEPYTSITTGFFAAYNPLAGAMYFEAFRIYPYRYSPTYHEIWSHFGIGSQTVACLAYLQQAALIEWMPALFMVLRLRYDIYYYLGEFGAVLSYESPPSKFMESDLNNRWGEEEAAFGQRVLFQPTLRGRLGPVSAQNQTDIAWYDTSAEGPYVFNWEYETFTTLKDVVIENRTDILLSLQKGEGETGFMFGPQYTFTWAASAYLKRHRVGLSAYWVPRDRKDKKGYFWICLVSGVNIRSALEEGSPFVLLAAGGSWRLPGKKHSRK
jgi:hypothetical protein